MERKRFVTLTLTARWKNTVLDSVVVNRPGTVTLGGFGSVADLKVDLLDVPAETVWPVAEVDESVCRLRIPEFAEDVQYPGHIATGLRQVELRPGDRAEYRIKNVSFELSVRLTAKDRTPRAEAFDRRYAGTFCATALCHVAFVVAAGMAEARTEAEVPPVIYRQARMMNIKMVEAAPKKPSPAVAASDQTPTAKPTKHHPTRGGTGKIKLDVKRVGIVGLLNEGRGGALASVMGGSLTNGLSNALAGVAGAGPGLAGDGLGGLGSRGGIGGDGLPVGLGGGSGGTIATCRGSDGCGAPRDLGGGHRGGIATRGSTPSKVQGGLSKEEVARVIRRNHARFAFCYERELNANPNLAGKVALSFTIAPNGRVGDIGVEESSVGSDAVESCVQRVMASLEFPQPRGGGVVDVRYPFVFTNAG